MQGRSKAIPSSICHYLNLGSDWSLRRYASEIVKKEIASDETRLAMTKDNAESQEIKGRI